LNEKQMKLRELIRHFAEERIKPIRAALDESDQFPIDLMKELGRLDFFRIFIPEEYEGYIKQNNRQRNKIE